MSLEPSSYARASPLPQPGSLEYINRPNPVEPSNLSHGSFDGSARELDRTTNEQLNPFLLGSRLRRDIVPEVARTRHHTHHTSSSSIAAVLNDDELSLSLREYTPYRRDVDQALFTLPKLVPVKRGTKRHRVPPVLQGLHQPPPEARLLPSISTEDSQVLLSTSTSRSKKNLLHSLDPEKEATSAPPEQGPDEFAEAPQNSTGKRPRRNLWTDQETQDLLEGVSKFGIGSWKKILLYPDYHFHKRTAVDLKDRFRVCRPDAYGGNRKTPKTRPKPSQGAKATESNDSSDILTPEAPERSTNSQKLPDGTADPQLWKAQRRPRRNFTVDEDNALLNGFHEQGASWVSILKDSVFQKHNRTATDLRDRFRTRFPEEYAKAGLASRPAVPKPAKRTKATRAEAEKSATALSTPPSATGRPTDTIRNDLSIERPEKAVIPRRVPTYSLPLPDIEDDSLSYFGFPDDDDDPDPIVLDRSIVDWANNNMPSSSRTHNPQMTDSLALPGIDPLVTLNMPKSGLF